MAGPCATVFISTRAAVDAESVVRNIVERVSEAVEGENFWVSSTCSIGGTSVGTSRPFFWTLEFVDRCDPESATPPQELDHIERFASFVPGAEIGFCAMCNGDEDHRILAELLLACADKLAGVVHFNGDLPRLSDAERQQLPRRSTRIMAEGSDHLIGSIVGDARFLSSWLNHECFRMVK